ncbi:MAG: hypothetical protein ACI4OY_03610 [Aristaeellaceae bacterium]
MVTLNSFRDGRAPLSCLPAWGARKIDPCRPRAALMESASFFLDDALAWRDRQRLHQQVMTAGNLLDSERDEVFWVWLEGFPQALADVLHDDGFRRYLAWEESRLPCLRQELAGERLKTDHVLFRCRQAYALPLERVCAVVNPIKRAGATDYHLQSGALYCTSGCFRAESIIHECLHLAVHPHMDSLREKALAHQEPWPDVDASYYLAGSEDGWMNAFEEYAVRCLTDRVMAGQTPVLQQFLAELAKPTAV